MPRINNLKKMRGGNDLNDDKIYMNTFYERIGYINKMFSLANFIILFTFTFIILNRTDIPLNGNTTSMMMIIFLSIMTVLDSWLSLNKNGFNLTSFSTSILLISAIILLVFGSLPKKASDKLNGKVDNQAAQSEIDVSGISRYNSIMKSSCYFTKVENFGRIMPVMVLLGIIILYLMFGSKYSVINSFIPDEFKYIIEYSIVGLLVVYLIVKQIYINGLLDRHWVSCSAG